jgi:hypothetical protein
LTPPYSEEEASRFEFVSTEAVDPEKQYANWSSGTITPFLINNQQRYQEQTWQQTDFARLLGPIVSKLKFH